jgi:hypothetical protein
MNQFEVFRRRVLLSLRSRGAFGETDDLEHL